MPDLIKQLEGLRKQAETERSHYYVADRVGAAIEEITKLREDKARLDKLEKYLADDAKNISGPTPGDPTWQFGYNGGMAYVIEGGGTTLREAIDSLPN